jgi:hypothetical protein
VTDDADEAVAQVVSVEQHHEGEEHRYRGRQDHVHRRTQRVTQDFEGAARRLEDAHGLDGRAAFLGLRSQIGTQIRDDRQGFLHGISHHAAQSGHLRFDVLLVLGRYRRDIPDLTRDEPAHGARGDGDEQHRRHDRHDPAEVPALKPQDQRRQEEAHEHRQRERDEHALGEVQRRDHDDA